MDKLQGIVKGFNLIQCQGKLIKCWKNAADATGKRKPLDLTLHEHEVVEVKGLFSGDLWKSKFIKKYSKSKEAGSLNDLLRIRALKENHMKIEAVNGYLGTALGFKLSRKENTKHPSIIIFVPKKKSSNNLSPGELAPSLLEYNNIKNKNDEFNGKWCLTDVVEGKKAYPIQKNKVYPLSSNNEEAVKTLRAMNTNLIGGVMLAYYGNGIVSKDNKKFGTAGIAVKEKTTGDIGFLTNQHIAETPGRKIYHKDWGDEFQIGSTLMVKEYQEDHDWYNRVVDEQNTKIRCDCGFVKIDKAEINSGLYKIRKLGPIIKVDYNTMDIIGQPVISVGCTRGIQRGEIAAYSYEYRDGATNIYTDFLIIGKEKQSFTAPGDSGKLIVTDEDICRPIGLLWGGEQGQLSSDIKQDVWGKASDLSKVLDILNLEIL